MPAYKDSKRNTWYAKIYVHDDITGENKQILKRGFATKRDALRWESEQFTDDAQKHTSATFAELDNIYIDYKNPKKESTRKQEQTRVQKYLPFANEPITAITKAELMEWYTGFIKRDDISDSTKNFCIGVVRSVFRFGHDFYSIPNTAAGLKKLKRKKKKSQMETWIPEEFATFASAVGSAPYRNCFTFMYCTGVRRGEALALRAEDFDLLRNTVHIYHQIRYFHVGFQDLKTESSERTLHLPENVMQFMLPLIKQCTESSPFVFGGERSLPITNLQRHFTAGIKASGVKPIRIHDLRHSFATNAINSGCNIVAVSHYLGHSTIQQTLDTYTHLLEKTDEEMVGIIGKINAGVIQS